METKNLAQLYELPALAWGPVRAQLDQGFDQVPERAGAARQTTWLTTTNQDGSPHTTPVGAVWIDDAFWFQSGDGARKARNIVRDPRCTMSVSIADYDVVASGTAAKIDDPKAVERVVARWFAGGWPVRVDETGYGLTAEFNAPSAGPAPWFVYRLTLDSATALQTSAPGGATRWRF
ncbi:pyridoxamine 5'-phosphate oxidase family protein [Nocardia callitridis]|uniref:Pyridoxamine 5'-phosphate oxidase family protein n=1 Tax=Nocardia callitridis TaxID=648753 RepID=A0ABP9L097_9NOCA